MDSFGFLLATCCLIFQGNAQYQPYSFNNLHPYPNYPVVGTPIPNLAPQNRFFWTWTSTTTSTSTTTCTVPASIVCPVRRKKFILEDSEKIQPSSANKLETTQIPKPSSDRKEREVDFETILWIDPATYEVQSTISNPNFFWNANPYFREPINSPVVGPRFFIRVTTSTTTSISTYTSRPACYSGSSFNRCQ